MHESPPQVSPSGLRYAQPYPFPKLFPLRTKTGRIGHLVGEGLKDGNDTLGAASAPAAAWKKGFSLKPKMPAYKAVGKLLTWTLYVCAALLKSWRATAIRFSVPSICTCRSRKLLLAFNSG